MNPFFPVSSSRIGNYCGRHPLFVTALVAAACVLVGRWGWPWALALSAVFGLLGWTVRNRQTGLAWWLVGTFAIGVYNWRDAARRTDERVLLASPGATVQGRVLKDAKGKAAFWRAPVVLLSGPRPGAKVWWEGKGDLPVAGAKVTARGDFGPLSSARNPGEFDQAAWLRSHGVSVTFHSTRLPGEVATGRWADLGARIRRGFRAAVTDGLPEASREAVVIRAVVIGEAPQDADELVAAFRNSGTLHAFSVSGLHVSMVGLIAWFLLRSVGLPRRYAVLVLLPLIFGYAWLTGNSPPAVRAAWMAFVFLGAFVTRRRPDLLNALGAVLLGAMLWDGRLLFQPGVQLSYGVVAAIAIGAGWGTRVFSWLAKPELYLPPRLMNWRQRSSLWVRTKAAQSLGVSLVAGIGSTPLTAYHFGIVTPVSVLAGLVFVPQVFVLLSAALLAAALHPIFPAGAQVLNRLNGRVANCCVRTAEACAAIPGGHFKIRRESQPFILIYDLERGAGAGVFSDGREAAVLLDSGDPFSFKRRLVPSLRRLGVAPDTVVLSHPDGSHLGGGAPVWEMFPIRQVLLPVERARSPGFRSWLDEAPRAQIRTFQAAKVDSLAMPDGARMEVVHFGNPHSPNALADDRVAIFRLHWRGWKLLFTSDAGLGTELETLDSGRDISADVIIAGHHSSDAMLGDRFLEAVHPRAIVATHADFPEEERLSAATVGYWRSRGIKVMPQGETGGVTLRVDAAGNLRLEGFVNRAVVVLTRPH